MGPCPCWALLSVHAHCPARYVAGSFPVCPVLSLRVRSLSLFCAFLHGVLFPPVASASTLASQTLASAGFRELLVCHQCDLEDLLLLWLPCKPLSPNAHLPGVP